MGFSFMQQALIRAAAIKPQLIYNQSQLVAAVIEAKIFQEFLAWQQQYRQDSLADAFAQLRQLCAEENYTFEIPPPPSFASQLNK